MEELPPRGARAVIPAVLDPSPALPQGLPLKTIFLSRNQSAGVFFGPRLGGCYLLCTALFPSNGDVRLCRTVYRLRNARPQDRPGLLELAQILNTLNLPPDPAVLESLLEDSAQAFGGGAQAAFDPDRHWTLVLEDPSGQVVGTSALHAQHGTPDAPHNFFRVEEVEHCSVLPADTEITEGSPVPGKSSRALYQRQQVLQLDRTFDGPTEVGGLVLSPACRGLPGKLGSLLSYGRFLLVATRRGLFRPQMLAEVLPPLGSDAQGDPTSALWDALGAKFSGLAYNDADKLSRTHLDLIPSLFPTSKIYVSLLPSEAQEVIAQVGEGSKGAAHLLKKIGFYQSNEVDPFDGGPHLHGHTDALAPVRQGQWAQVKVVKSIPEGETGYIAHDREDGEFRAVRSAMRVLEDRVELSSEVAQVLEADQGTKVWVWNETHLGDARSG